MCGIDGIFSKDLQSDPVKKMTSSLVHRGPHSEGYYHDKQISLGMRRLKVIDLLTGDQPLFNETKDVVVIFNGEIYNFQELKKNLVAHGHKFKTNTDTEILTHGYEEWGIDELLSRINGMFGFCIYDKKKGLIFLARDRIGEKPLYYFFDGKNFVFASELVALLDSSKIPIKICKLALYYYLSVHFVPGDLSIIQGVKKLLPGHYIEFNLNKFEHKVQQYWELREKKFHHRDYSDCIKHTKLFVEEATKRRKVSDVKIGVFLSGGIDSSVIATILQNYNKDLDTFSIGFENQEFDESDYSKLVASKLNTNHHHFTLNSSKLKDLLPNVVNYMDEPIGDPALIPVYWLAHEAKNYVTVVISGEGGDEIFGGYSYYSKDSKYKTDSIFSFLQFDKLETLSGFPLVSDHTINSKLIKNFNFEELKEESKQYSWVSNLFSNYNSIEDKLKRRQYADIKTWLPDDLLMKFDKMTMANSIEGRAPFLDYRLVEYVFNLPSELKIKNGVYKLILREAFRDELPDEIVERKKQGFNLPIAEWLRTDLKDLLESISTLKIDDGLNSSFIKKLIDEHMKNQVDRSRLLFSILVYRLWVQRLFERLV